jgi:hypothetical protein
MHYTLRLDLHLQFIPLIPEVGSGIVLTRVIQLPFPAHEGMRVYSRPMDETYHPMGFNLHDVVWDLDRKVFLADTYCVSDEIPLALMAKEIQAWLARGWRLGSYRDDYPDPLQAVAVDETTFSKRDAAYEALERLHMLAPKRRGKEFNRFFKAIVRYLAESFVNSDVGYAMEKTGRYFSDEDIMQRGDKPRVKEWQAIREEFGKLSSEDQCKWRDRTLRFPELKDAILGPDRRG